MILPKQHRATAFRLLPILALFTLLVLLPLPDSYAARIFRSPLAATISHPSGETIERSFVIKADRTGPYAVTISIPKRQVEETRQGFGYNENNLDRELALLAERFNRSHAPRFRITSISHRKGYSYHYQRGFEQLSGEFKKQFDLTVRDYFGRQHFRYGPEGIAVDYPAVQDWQAGFVKELYGRMLQTAQHEAMQEREFVTLLVNFVQQLRYRIPPDSVGGTKTGGFWPPVTCLVEQAGDCDSKSTLFATLYGHYRKNGSIMLMTERHAFIGIRDQHRVLPRDRVITRGGRDYLLVEMTNSLPMGVISKKDWDQVAVNRAKYVEFH